MICKCSYYWWPRFKVYGPAYCCYKDRMVKPNYCSANCLQGGFNCGYYQEAVSLNFLELIMNICIKDGIEVNKELVYESLNKVRDYLVKKFNQEGINILVCGDRIGLEIACGIRNSSDLGLFRFLEVIYDEYIKSIVDYVSCEDYETALSFYKKMIDDLVVNLGLGQRFANINSEIRKPSRTKFLRALSKGRIGSCSY